MSSWNYTFGKLAFEKKLGAAAAIVGALGVSLVASTDTFQKIHVKHKLLTGKFPKPPHMSKVIKYILKCHQIYVYNNPLAHYICISTGSSTRCQNDWTIQLIVFTCLATRKDMAKAHQLRSWRIGEMNFVNGIKFHLARSYSQILKASRVPLMRK